MKICSIQGCENRHYGRSWCEAHYKRWAKTGDVRESEPLGRYSPEAIERMASTLRGRKFGARSPEWGAAISAAKKGRSNGLMGRAMAAGTKEKIGIANGGEGNGNWKGDDVGYIAMHDRLRKVLPATCSHCGADRPLECALRHDAVGPLKTDEMRVHGKMRTVAYSTLVSDYMRLCVKCHRRYDLAK